MRMLYRPSLSPFNASKRLPGGIRKSFKQPATSSCLSFLLAILSKAPKRLTRIPRANNAVSLSRNDCIIVSHLVINVKRYYFGYKANDTTHFLPSYCPHLNVLCLKLKIFLTFSHECSISCPGKQGWLYFKAWRRTRPIRKNAVRQNGVIHNGWATRIRTRTKGTKNPCAAITPWPSKKKAGEPRLWKNRWWAVRESNPRPWD